MINVYYTYMYKLFISIKRKPMRDISDFSLKCVKIMAHLLETDTVNDEVLETLRGLELEYYSLLDKTAVLEAKVNIDPKTNLLKYKDDYLVRIIKTASRIIDDEKRFKSNFNIAYVRFDIDDFSKINNTYGHDSGDKILIDFSNLLKTRTRPTDYIIRFGGEEFDALLQGNDERGAKVVMNKIYKEIEKLEYDFEGKLVKFTVSAGLALLSFTFESMRQLNEEQLKAQYKDLQKKADDALYHAKYLGKNQVQVYDPSIDYSEIRKLYADSKGG